MPNPSLERRPHEAWRPVAVFYPDLVKLMDYDWAYSLNKARTELGYKNRSIYTSLKELLNNDFTDTFMKPVR